MRLNVTHDKGQARLAMEWRFDFGCRQDFGAACDSALAAAANKTVSLTNGRGVVGEVLRVAKFDRLFTMN